MERVRRKNATTTLRKGADTRTLPDFQTSCKTTTVMGVHSHLVSSKQITGAENLETIPQKQTHF